jgi:8-oxo-dGTP pyrophosphatase MutT (NUDIX family)
MDLGESITQAAVREVREETGIEVEITGLVGIYTNPRHLIEYTSDGEVRQEFSIVFTARPRGGVPTTSDEAAEVVWVDPADVSALRMHPSMQQRIEHYRQRRAEPYLG